jgi:hypothetical protein
MSPKGAEYITVADQLLMRTSTTAKVWNGMNLIQYFNKGVVINALPDAPEQQLPTARLKTHTFSPDEMEIVSFKDRYWKRKDGDLNWETGELKDYFTGHQLEAVQVAQPAAPTPAAAPTTMPGAPVDPKAANKPQDKTTDQTNDLTKTASANAKLDPKLDPNNSKDSKVKDIADAKKQRSYTKRNGTRKTSRSK